MESNSTLPSVLAPATQSHDPDDILRDPEAGSPFFEASITAMSSQDRRPGLGSDGSMPCMIGPKYRYGFISYILGLSSVYLSYQTWPKYVLFENDYHLITMIYRTKCDSLP
jgi:hypothetical protein